MGSTHLEEELGRLSGQLHALAPALEHMEERERDTVAKIAILETKGDGIRRDVDQLVGKISARLRSIYTRLETISTQSATHIGMTDLRTLYQRVGDLETATGNLQNAVGALEKSRASVLKKVWDVSKILITIVLTALATKYLGGGAK
jgi:chromosome segregation ATPase